MSVDNDFIDNIYGIFNSIGISYTEENGERFKVCTGRLDKIAPLSDKAILRLYIEFIQDDGTPFYLILGVITEKIQQKEVIGMFLKTEFETETGIKQIWISPAFKKHVRVIVPSHNPSVRIETWEAKKAA